jgi:hypothetical protein
MTMKKFPRIDVIAKQAAVAAAEAQGIVVTDADLETIQGGLPSAGHILPMYGTPGLWNQDWWKKWTSGTFTPSNGAPVKK